MITLYESLSLGTNEKAEAIYNGTYLAERKEANTVFQL